MIEEYTIKSLRGIGGGSEKEYYYIAVTIYIIHKGMRRLCYDTGNGNC
jgi:hypothetical protein